MTAKERARMRRLELENEELRRPRHPPPGATRSQP